MMTKTDQPPQLAAMYRAHQEPSLVDVPELTFLMIDGHGDPNSSVRYQQAVQALYTVSYGLKFAVRRAGGDEFKVAPLEGLWWTPDMADFSVDDKASWNWTMMIRQPEHLSSELVEHCQHDAVRTKQLILAHELRLARFHEGHAAQILHVGAYADEAPTIARLHKYLTWLGYTRCGKHHEIYLGDPRRCAPDRLKTIIRQPIAEVC
jgi:hypothetical protein